MNKRILWVGIFILSAAAIAEAANEFHGSKQSGGSESGRGKISKVEDGREIQSEPLFSAVVESAAIENGLPASLLYGLFWHESRFREDATRTEMHLCRKHHWSKSECRSYGLGQVVFGYHRKDCGLNTTGDLANLDRSVRCTAQILGGYLKAEKGSIPRALKRFNGPLGKNYAQKVIAEARMFGSQL